MLIVIMQLFEDFVNFGELLLGMKGKAVTGHRCKLYKRTEQIKTKDIGILLYYLYALF